MDTNQSSIAILADAKEEYTRQLINILRTNMYVGIQSIYNDAKNVCSNENRPNDVLMVFQDLLSRIPKWSQDIINKEYGRIVESSGCDWIEDLLKVIYVAHIKVLTIVNSAQKNKKISLKIPTGGHFTHLCYIELAREFWKNPYLFSDRVSRLEYQKNIRECENIIANCIVETIRKQLPVRHILKEYFAEGDDTLKEEELSAAEEDDIKKAISPKYLKKIETIVKRELKNNDNFETGMEDTIRKIIQDELANQQKPPSEDKPVDKTLVAQITEKVIETVGTTSNSNSNISSMPNESSNNGGESTALTTNNIISSGIGTAEISDNSTKLSVSKAVTTENRTSEQPTSVSDDIANSVDKLITTQSLDPKKEDKPLEIGDKSAPTTIKLSLCDVSNDVSNDVVVNHQINNTDIKNISINPTKNLKVSKNESKSQLESLLNDEPTPTTNNNNDTPLQISDIADVNLNLNELEDLTDIDNELEEVNLEVKSDPNTEYKFF